MSASPKVPAADQTLRILLLLAAARGPMPASRIAAQLGIPRSSIYHLLDTLQKHGFVMHLREEKRYGLGIAAIELSSAYARQEPLTRLGTPLLQALTDTTSISSHLAVLHGTDVVYLIEQRAPHSPSLVSDRDVRLPASLTATGRAILAAMPKQQVRALFPNQKALQKRPGMPHKIDRYSKLRIVLDEAQSRGYALEIDEITEGFSSVGVAVLDHRGWPVAAIAATYQTKQLSAPERTVIATAVAKTAQTLSGRLHGRADQAQMR